MEKEIAIKVENVSKTFKIPHEKITSLRGAFVNVFRKKSYEEFKALDNVSFEVRKGEFFGIIGRNGSGKSTLLKILAGIYEPDKIKKGRVYIDGMISPFLELGIGFNPELSGRDNIYLNATVLGLTRKQIDKKFDAIVRFSELKRFIDQKLKNYSSGMQVRLAFSVAIHANREILLMDEVLAVGDSNFQGKCIEEFMKYKKNGKTIVLVSHDIGTIQQYCDRAILLRDGEVIKIGKASEVSDEYIYKNISDEEKRIFDQEIKDEKKNKGAAIGPKKVPKKVAEISSIEFLDSDGNIKNVFKTGDDFSVRVNLRINKMQDVFNFGFGICDEQDNYLFGINSILDKVDTRPYVKNNYLQVDFKNIILRKGRYYVRVSIVKENFLLPYDMVPKSKYFEVISMEKGEGIIEMQYQWSKIN